MTRQNDAQVRRIKNDAQVDHIICIAIGEVLEPDVYGKVPLVPTVVDAVLEECRRAGLPVSRSDVTRRVRQAFMELSLGAFGDATADPTAVTATRKGRRECTSKESRVLTRTTSAPLLSFDGQPALSLTPALKWAGGKVWQRPRILPLWLRHAHRRLVEPCCGALGMVLGLQPARACLNDRNPHLMNFHAWVQQGLTIDCVMQNDERLYYEYRDRFNALAASDERASRDAAAYFYFLNRTGFNGLCRFNRQGQFNVPFGAYHTIVYRRDFSDYQAAYATWTFTTGDFEQVPLDPEDFVYCDPPYDTEFTAYAPDGFSWEDQVRLVTWLSAHPGPVVLCNQATARIVALYQRAGFQLDVVEAPRRISCTGDRRPATEVIATRNLDAST